MNALIIKSNTSNFPFRVKKEMYGKISVYKISNEYLITRKKLIKKLNKDRIVNIAFDNNISHNFISFFESKINVVTKNNILINNMDKMALKLSNYLGIKEGTLTLGIIDGYKTDFVIKKVIELRNKLKMLCIYTKSAEKIRGYADAFYRATGVPVVIKEGYKNIDCDILINLSASEIKLNTLSGKLIDIFETCNKKGISDIKINFKEEDNIFNISDAVYNKIISDPFKVDFFISKNT